MARLAPSPLSPPRCGTRTALAAGKGSQPHVPGAMLNEEQTANYRWKTTGRGKIDQATELHARAALNK